MNLTNNSKKIRHYISLERLIKILKDRRLTLSFNGKKWEDKNDVKAVSYYKKKTKSGIAIFCATGIYETFHHWMTYGGKNKTNKTCVVFDKSQLNRELKKGVKLLKSKKIKGRLISKQVQYYNLKQLKNNKIELNNLPFIKRSQFSDEQEMRFIWLDKNTSINAIKIPISLKCIEKIYTSPWLEDSEHDRISRKLKKLSVENLIIQKSTITDGKRWISSLYRSIT